MVTGFDGIPLLVGHAPMDGLGTSRHELVQGGSGGLGSADPRGEDEGPLSPGMFEHRLGHLGRLLAHRCIQGCLIQVLPPHLDAVQADP